MNQSPQSYPAEAEPPVKEPKSLYEQALEYVKCYNNSRSEVNATSSLCDYDSTFKIKMPFKDWVKFRDDLNVGEADEA